MLSAGEHVRYRAVDDNRLTIRQQHNKTAKPTRGG
ncbi:hypothetical protein EPYR_01680 [Erwinia pyrifoliae DSM 12163]|nr:hypothetical protein EPYR_01680 [Erwinia pyrifoliae DSM 12163]